MQDQDLQPALPLRQHTILGVCEGIAEDFGFNPIFLRVPLAAGVLFSPQYAIAAYLALGVLVLASRLLFPKPKIVADAQTVEPAAPVIAANSEEQPQLPLAA
jgi:phage shock protein PspC (stress-responsive transcriptional regulator)